MGIGDKISGRVKQAAGDLVGSEDLHSQGAQEERKGEAKEELEREEARAEATRSDADLKRVAAERRAAEAAERELERADQVAEAQQARADAASARAERKRDEVDALEYSTNPRALAADHTRDELYERAKELDVEGRSDMTKDELADEIARRQ